MPKDKFTFSSLLSWVLLFVILVALGISSYQAYVSIKIQEDLYSKIWETVTPKTEDEEGNEIPAANVIYKMNIYDYTDAVLVNIPVGSNDCYYDQAHKNWGHDKAYIKYLKNADGSMSFDGVILNHGYRNFWGKDKHEIRILKSDDSLSKEYLQKAFEYIFVGSLESSWTTECNDPTIDFNSLNSVECDYLITYQQQTDEAHSVGGIFAKLYKQIVEDAKKCNISTKTYTKQFLHNTSQLQYIKCFVDGECINANIYCEYTRTLFTHSLPNTLDMNWYNSEILGGNA